MSSLAAGTRLGPYEILALLGAGGMGEVYRARDARLARDVAIKVLPTAFSADPERLARFEREARALAALNHPHIAAIYGLEAATGEDGLPIHALVLELVAGDTLAERLARGPMGNAEAVALARQIASALEAAHEQGLVHRDLKPANIKLRPDGAVKVLDFGLAKTIGLDSSAAQPSHLETSFGDATRAGVILGTAAYMSPEQARGLAVDRRTDIWAFGCVLYEMLTGRISFAGPTASDSIAAIIGREPDWSALPADVPPGVSRLLRRCLEKDVKRRLRDIGDVDLALDISSTEVAADSAATGRRPARPWLPWTIATVAAAAAAGLALWVLARPASPIEPAATVRFEIDPGVSLSESGQFAVSPDSRHIVFAGSGADGILRLWIRSFDSLETRPLLGTEAEVVQAIPPMFWSPDSRYIGFFAGGRVKKVERTGGLPQVVCEVSGVAVGGSWNRDDVILVGNTEGGLHRCPAAGGTPSLVTTTEKGEKQASHFMPSFLQDGRHFLYLRVWRGRPADNGLFIGDLDTPAERQRTDRLVATGYGGGYVADGPTSGHILFMRDGALISQRLDATTLARSGEVVTVAQSVGAFLDTAFFTASKDVVVYRGAVPDYQLTWIDRRGSVVGKVAEPAEYVHLDLSPDGNRIVVSRENRINRADRDLWLIDVVRNTSTRFTSDPALESAPAWSADGAEVFFAAGGRRQAELKRKPATGGREVQVLLENGGSVNQQATTLGLTPDGRFLIYTGTVSDGTKDDLFLLPLVPPGAPRPLIQQDGDQTDGRVSPDGRWLAYVSNESGADEVFARRLVDDPTTRLPIVDAQVLVSRGGGFAPRWRKDGKELLYQSRGGAVMGAALDNGEFAAPRELFRVSGALPTWAISPDGQRFLLALPTRQTASAFSTILNWRSALEP